MRQPQVLRTPDRVARSAIARSRVQRENRRAAAQDCFLKDWVPDLRAGFAPLRRRSSGTRGCATSCMARDVIYARERHQWMSDDIYEIRVIYVSSVADTTQH